MDGVEVGLSSPKSIGLSGPEISACQQGLRADHSTVPREPLSDQLSGLPGLAKTSSEHSRSSEPMVRAPKHSDPSETTKVLSFAITSQSNALDHTKHSSSRDPTMAHRILLGHRGLKPPYIWLTRLNETKPRRHKHAQSRGGKEGSLTVFTSSHLHPPCQVSSDLVCLDGGRPENSGSFPYSPPD